MGNGHPEAVLRALEGICKLCSQRGSSPISASEAEVLAFLASLVTQGSLEYRTIALYRSAISQAHDPVGSTQLGSLPDVTRFMKGVFKI